MSVHCAIKFYLKQLLQIFVARDILMLSTLRFTQHFNLKVQCDAFSGIQWN